MSDKHDDHHDQELAHALPVSMLGGVLLALFILTAATVWFALQGFGAQLSFMIAMVIATIKAGLVMAVFMHLWWDKRINVLAFLGCFLFVMLFLGMAITDKSEFAPDVEAWEEAQEAQAQ